MVGGAVLPGCHADAVMIPPCLSPCHCCCPGHSHHLVAMVVMVAVVVVLVLIVVLLFLLIIIILCHLVSNNKIKIKIKKTYVWPKRHQ